MTPCKMGRFYVNWMIPFKVDSSIKVEMILFKLG